MGTEDSSAHAGLDEQEQKTRRAPVTLYERWGELGLTETIRLVDQVNHVIIRKSSFHTIVRIVARLLSQNLADPEFVASREQRQLAEKAVFVAATCHSDPSHFARLNPVLRRGVLVTEGDRLGRLPLVGLTGHDRLPLLAYDNPLSRVIMLEAHSLDHLAVDSTLEESRRKAWIASGRKLAQKIYDECIICRRREARRIEQAVGPVVKDSKSTAEYSLAKVVKAEPSERGGLIRNVTLAALPENTLRKAENYDVTKYELKPVAAEDLMLLESAREVEEEFGTFGMNEVDDYCELETAVPLEDKVTGLDQALDG